MKIIIGLTLMVSGLFVIYLGGRLFYTVVKAMREEEA